MKRLLLGLTAVAAVAIAVPVALSAGAYNGTASLVHQGVNPPQCAVPFAGTDSTASGVVNVHFNVVQQRFAVNVSVHDAMPNTTYVVDVRCVGAIGMLTTNGQGTGTAHIEHAQTTLPPTFYIDIAVPGPGGSGAGGYGDTFIAGPFNLG
jgi:hypothetical protein